MYYNDCHNYFKPLNLHIVGLTGSNSRPLSYDLTILTILPLDHYCTYLFVVFLFMFVSNLLLGTTHDKLFYRGYNEVIF